MAEAKARSRGVGVDLCLIGAVLRLKRPVRSARCGSSDWSSVYGRRTRARSVLAHRFSLSLSLSLRV